MTSLKEMIEKTRHRHLTNSLRSLEKENIEGLEHIICSFKALKRTGIYEDLVQAHSARQKILPRPKELIPNELPPESLFRLAYDNLPRPYLLIPITKIQGRIPPYKIFEFVAMYKIIEFLYLIRVKRELHYEDLKNIYLSGLDEQLIFALNQFDDVLDIPQPTNELFERIQKTIWEDWTTERFFQNLNKIRNIIAYEEISILKFSRLFWIENLFLKLIARCSAVKEGRDRINREDIVISYKTYLKLLNTDVTKYKARIPLAPNKENEYKGYLVCEKCNGYYKLQPGESPEDPQNLRFWDPGNGASEGFTGECECRGKLNYYDKIDDLLED